MTKRLPAPGAWHDGLTDRERRFVVEYSVDLNATQAALRAGLGKGNVTSARDYATQLRRKPRVATAIAAYLAENYGASHSRVLEELAKLAFYDISDAVTVENGMLVVKDFSELDPDVRAAIVSVEEHITESGNRTLRVKLADKNTALKTLASCLNLKRSVNAEPTVQVNIQNNVTEARDRVLSRLDALLLPAPAEQPMPLIEAAAKDPVHAQ